MLTRALLALSLPALLAAAPAPARNAEPGPKLELSIQEFASRIEIGHEALQPALDGKAATTALTIGGSLEGWKVKTVARAVTVDGASKGYWMELTLLGKDSTEKAYLAVVLPEDPKAAFSAATRFEAGKAGKLTAVVTRAK